MGQKDSNKQEKLNYNIKAIIEKFKSMDRLLAIPSSFIVIFSIVVLIIACIENSFNIAFSGLTAVGTIGVAMLSICMVFRNEEKEHKKNLKHQCGNITKLIIPKIDELISYYESIKNSLDKNIDGPARPKIGGTIHSLKNDLIYI